MHAGTAQPRAPGSALTRYQEKDGDNAWIGDAKAIAATGGGKPART